MRAKISLSNLNRLIEISAFTLEILVNSNYKVCCCTMGDGLSNHKMQPFLKEKVCHWFYFKEKFVTLRTSQ